MTHPGSTSTCFSLRTRREITTMECLSSTTLRCGLRSLRLMANLATKVFQLASICGALAELIGLMTTTRGKLHGCHCWPGAAGTLTATITFGSFIDRD